MFSHDLFTIALQGSDDSSLCGGLTYWATIDGKAIENMSSIVYEPSRE